MSFRVSTNGMNNMFFHGYSRSLSRYVDQAERVSKQRGLLSPDENPLAFSNALGFLSNRDSYKQYATNAKEANSWLDTSTGSLSRIVTMLQEVHSKAQTAADASTSAQDRESIANEMHETLQEMLRLGNTQYAGRYIFAGTKTDTQPFDNAPSTISNIRTLTGSPNDIRTSTTYSDVRDLKEGEYTIRARVEHPAGSTTRGLVHVEMLDEHGNPVSIDADGGDTSGSQGNQLARELVTTFEPGKTINLGRGVALKLPEDDKMPANGSLEYAFEFKPGSRINYRGDDGDIDSLISQGSAARLSSNGQSVFMNSYQTVRTSVVNHSNGLSMEGSTLFTGIDGAKQIASDSISLRGLDHDGHPAGSAVLNSPAATSLNLVNSSSADRTLKLSYANSYFQVTVPAASYKNMQELTTAINDELRNAQYLGPVKDFSTGASLDPADPALTTGLREDLSGQIVVGSSGNKLTFATNKTGDGVYLSIAGSVHNSLGFANATALGTAKAYGHDTQFEFGYDDYKPADGYLQATHTINGVTAGNKYAFTVNGKDVTLDVPTGFNATSAKDMLTLQSSFNKALRQAGFDHDVTSQISVTTPAGGLNVSFTEQNINFNAATSLQVRSTANMTNTFYRNSTFPQASEKHVNDLLKFTEDLFQGSVEAKVDGGRIKVTDLRSGDSDLNVSFYANNEGIDYIKTGASQQISGRYDGSTEKNLNVQYKVNYDGGNDKYNLDVYILDERGRIVQQSKIDDYRGGDIDLRYGVKWTPSNHSLDAARQNPTVPFEDKFNVHLQGGGALSLGDTHVIETGGRTAVFDTVRQFIDASKYNVLTNGASNISEWEDTRFTDPNMAKPNINGDFTGHFNDRFHFIAENGDFGAKAYIQEEQQLKLGALNFPFTSTVTANVTLNVLDNATGKIQQETLKITGSNLSEFRKNLVTTINSSGKLADLGARAVLNSDDTVTLYSGTGTHTMFLEPKDMDTRQIFSTRDTNKATSDLQLDFKQPQHFDVSYRTPAGNWTTATVTVPPAPTGAFADSTALLATINGAMKFAKDKTTGATVDVSTIGTMSSAGNRLVFTKATGVPISMTSISGGTNSALGFADAGERLQEPVKPANLDLTTKGEEERTIYLRSMNGNNLETKKIILDAKAYSNVGEMITDINDKIKAIGEDSKFSAAKYDDGSFGIEVASGVVGIAEGDYDATLGLTRAGGRVKMNVNSESSGASIAEFYVDTANKNSPLMDGLSMNFYRGNIYSSNRFSASVGSGVTREIDIINSANNQVSVANAGLGSTTTRVKSTLSFYETFIPNLESRISDSLQQGDKHYAELTQLMQNKEDILKGQMQVLSKVQGLSLLDYLR